VNLKANLEHKTCKKHNELNVTQNLKPLLLERYYEENKDKRETSRKIPTMCTSKMICIQIIQKLL
jgi:hypothetical protein